MASAQKSNNTNYTPLSLARQQTHTEAPTPTTVKTLSQQIAALRSTAEDYETVSKQHVDLLGPIADTIDVIHNYRLSETASLAEDLEKWIDSVEKVKTQANSTEAIDAAKERVKTLNAERDELLAEILSGKKEVADLKEKLQQVEEELTDMRMKKLAITEKEESELITLQYLEKVLRNLSNAKITSSYGSSTLEGFVCKKESHDVIPFRYDMSTSKYDRVNHLWDLIGEQ